MLRDRLYPTPRRVVLGQAGTGWLGLVSSWVLLGFGAVLAALSGSGLADLTLACAASERVCGAAAWGGVVAGVTSVAVSLLFSIVIARGFGPPVRWWALPVGAAALGAGMLLGALLGEGEVPLGLLVAGAAVLALALLLGIVALSQGKAAVYGWVRLDGLSGREVPMRGVEALLPVVAVASFAAAAAFAVHTARLLASG
ncbi:hypothetical protein GCM10009846_02790 [Agrococcus versicolor]|uniref:ABC transporter permease n=1 Tax=Agrococcus versicolor TaxID=501482 RepID=A0ABN3AKE9_9MICO